MRERRFDQWARPKAKAGPSLRAPAARFAQDDMSLRLCKKREERGEEASLARSTQVWLSVFHEITIFPRIVSFPSIFFLSLFFSFLRKASKLVILSERARASEGPAFREPGA